VAIEYALIEAWMLRNGVVLHLDWTPSMIILVESIASYKRMRVPFSG
jgi:hypothetical protein